jgi:hypothetical protein
MKRLVCACQCIRRNVVPVHFDFAVSINLLRRDKWVGLMFPSVLEKSGYYRQVCCDDGGCKKKDEMLILASSESLNSGYTLFLAGLHYLVGSRCWHAR